MELLCDDDYGSDDDTPRMVIPKKPSVPQRRVVPSSAPRKCTQHPHFNLLPMSSATAAAPVSQPIAPVIIPSNEEDVDRYLSESVGETKYVCNVPEKETVIKEMKPPPPAEELFCARPKREMKEMTVEEIVRSNPEVSKAFMIGLENKDQQENAGAQFDAEWLGRMQDDWASNQKRGSAHFTARLVKCFSSSPNPYKTVLHLSENAGDYSPGKPTGLAFTILKEFERWIKSRHDKSQLTSEIQHRAFYLGIRGHMAHFELLVKSFSLNDDSIKERFVPVVRLLVEKQQYKEAAQCVTKLGLHDSFSIRDICLPLILQDKVNLVENYCYRQRHQQMELLKLLDWMCDDNVELRIVMLQNPVPHLKADRITRKAISKLAVRLMKLYQVPADVCFNIHRQMGHKALRYLLYRRYNERTVDDDQWFDLVLSTVEGNHWLQLQLVDELVSYLELKEAAKWAKHFNLPLEEIPEQIRSLVPMATPFREQHEDSTFTPSPHHHSLSVAMESVLMVEHKEAFLAAVQVLSKPGIRIGIDAEWRPTFGQVLGANRVSVLQLATESQVFLLDMLSLADCLLDSDWCMFAQNVMCTDQVLKLGYGLEGDLQALLKSLPVLKHLMKNLSNVIDLCDMYNWLRSNHSDILDRHIAQTKTERSVKVQPKEEKGLSEVVKHCLGKPLDKREQMSDWERRPLRMAQKYYAALDAFCLLEVHSVISSLIQRNGLDLQVCQQAKPTAIKVNHKSKQEKMQQRVAERSPKAKTLVANPAPPREGPSIAPADFSVVCDTMLQGLGRYLRCCGVNVAILENSDDHEVAAEIARKENRIVLTSGMPFNMLSQRVAYGKCFNVSPGKAKEQVNEVLKHFNVKVTSADIFSRCQVCNGNSYVKLPSADIQQAMDVHRKRSVPLRGIGRGVGRGIVRASKMGAQFNSANSSDNANSINFSTLCLGSVPLQLDGIPPQVVAKVKEFFVCTRCGKVFWEGSHFNHIHEQFADVLSSSDSGKTVYQTY